jgi:protein-disulfide isomerase-like protein with CxxC motif
MPVVVTYFTDPFCSWSWALEPVLRELEWKFGQTLSINYVMCGMARQFGEPQPLVLEILAAAAQNGYACRRQAVTPTPSGGTAGAAVGSARGAK